MLLTKSKRGRAARPPSLQPRALKRLHKGRAGIGDRHQRDDAAVDATGGISTMGNSHRMCMLLAGQSIRSVVK